MRFHSNLTISKWNDDGQSYCHNRCMSGASSHPWNQPRSSSGVMASKSSAMARSYVSRVRACVSRSAILSWLKAHIIGEESGECASRWPTRQRGCAIGVRIRLPVRAARLSRKTICLGRNHGKDTCSTEAVHITLVEMPSMNHPALAQPGQQRYMRPVVAQHRTNAIEVQVASLVRGTKVSACPECWYFETDPRSSRP